MIKSTVAKKKRKETWRLKKLCSIEKQVREQGFETIAGIDEVGRGPLAGPVVAATCILPENYSLIGINDSKKLTNIQRIHLYQELIFHPDIDFGVGVVEAGEIDRLNIHNATLEAMRRSLRYLKKKPSFLLIDGRHIPDIDIPSATVVDGDQNTQVIAAASIIAKVIRDLIMIGYHELYPEYGFHEHKGYGTSKHLDWIKKIGPSPIHRKSFSILKGEKNVEKHDSL